MSFCSDLRERMLFEGLCMVGFSSVSDILPERLKPYPNAITLVARLSDAVIDEVITAPTYSYFQHYRAVNALLDRCALVCCELIRREGGKAFPVAASQSVHDLSDEYTGIFQHKTAAVKAGIGWIGKSGLLVSPEHGPRMRLATVLTDLPLEEYGAPLPCGCSACTRCRDICPAGAILGREYIPGASRDTIFDARRCSEHMKRAYQNIGRGSVCGLCVSVCPYGKKG